MHWKIQLQVASILIKFMWCHFNWKYILHKSDEIIWTWLMFQRFPEQPVAAATNDPSEELIKTTNDTHTQIYIYIHIYIYGCDIAPVIFLAVIVCKPLDSGVEWADRSWSRALTLCSLYIFSFKAQQTRKEKVLHLTSNFPFNCKLAQLWHAGKAGLSLLWLMHYVIL